MSFLVETHAKIWDKSFHIKTAAKNKVPIASSNAVCCILQKGFFFFLLPVEIVHNTVEIIRNSFLTDCHWE